MNLWRKARSKTASAIQSVAEVVRPEPETDKTDALNERIDAMVKAGQRGNVPWNPIRESGYARLYGDQLTDAPTMPDAWTPAVDNQIKPLMAQEQAIMSQRRPRVVASAVNPDQASAVLLAGGILNWLFAKGLKVEMMLLKAKIDAQATGEWITALWWDERARWNKVTRRWEGRMRIDLLPPSCFFADPVAETPEDWRFAFTYRLIPVGEALSRWPEFRKEIIEAALKEDENKRNSMAPGVGDSRNSSRINRYQTGTTLSGKDTSDPLNMTNRTMLVDALNFFANPTLGEKTKGDEKNLPGYVSVLEMIFEDEETWHVPDMQDIEEASLIEDGMLAIEPDGTRVNPDTGAPLGMEGDPGYETWPQEDRGGIEPKYPNGRHIIRFGLTSVVHDKPWPYEHWMWDVGIQSPLPHTWHGEPAVEGVRDEQDILNQVRSYVLNYLKNHVDCERVVGENTLVGGEDLENVGELIAAGPNKITKVREGKANDYQLRPPPPLPSGLMDVIAMLTQTMRDKLGVQTVDQGRGDADTLGQDVLNETKSRLRTAMQALFLDDYCVRLMEHAWELVTVHMRDESIVRIVGEGGAVKGMAFDPAALDAEFDLSLEVGTVLPYDRERRKQDAITLFNLLLPLGMAGFVVKWILDAYEVPHAQDIVDQLLAGNVPSQPQPGQAEAVPEEGGMIEGEPQPTAVEPEPVAVG